MGNGKLTNNLSNISSVITTVCNTLEYEVASTGSGE